MDDGGGFRLACGPQRCARLAACWLIGCGVRPRRSAAAYGRLKPRAACRTASRSRQP